MPSARWPDAAADLRARLDATLEPPERGPGLGSEAAGERVAVGVGVAPGVAVGPAYLFSGGGVQAAREDLGPEQVEAELVRFEQAVARAERELSRISTVAREKLGDDSAAIFEAQAMMLRDAGFYDAVARRVRDEHTGAGWAVQTVLGEHRTRLEAAASAHLRERAADFLDVQTRVLRHLQQGRASAAADAGSVVVAQALTAADVLLFSRRGVRGLVLDFGGPTSHVAIMARALGVPTVVGLHGLSDGVAHGEAVVVDGFSGRVVVGPSEATRASAERKAARFARLGETREAVLAEPSETACGHAVALRANVEFREELPLLGTFGAEGIGLFRTEMLFLTQGRALDEAQQREVYAEALRAARPHPVTFRLLDLGGDKVLPMARREANPFLGWRGMRILLAKPDLLRPQLRALFRAAADVPDAPAQILLPMVSDVDEVRRLRRAVRLVADELAAEGTPARCDLPVGIMVEVPAVALLADAFARHADFFSVGTNDLTQFTLAVDRGNDLVADLFRELHPAVLALVARTAEAGKRRGLPVSVCGELAADPRVTPLLVGLGVDALSASPAYLSLVKRVLRAFTLAEAQDLAARALRQPDAASVRRLLDHFLACHNRDLAALFG